MDKYIRKYLAMLFIYLLISKFLNFYGFKIYYSIAEEPEMALTTYQTVQSILTSIIFSLNFVIALLLFLDMRRIGKVTWLIIGSTLIMPEIGVLLFLMDSFFSTKKTESHAD